MIAESRSGPLDHFGGRLQQPGADGYTVVTVQLEEGRFRMWSGRRRLGSWARSDVACERASPFRYYLTIDGERFGFVPDDPGGFGHAMDSVIDLRHAASRFGLAERLRKISD
ncbi:MAG: hypothetical protein ACRDVM_02695 [Acidimicrobiia bacterium]